MKTGVFVDYYKILGVPKDASVQDIKQAYRRLCKKYHPDLYPNEDEETIRKLTKKIQKISRAYSVLKNDEQRAVYDQKYDEQQQSKEEDTEREKQKARKQRQQRQRARREQSQQRKEQSPSNAEKLRKELEKLRNELQKKHQNWCKNRAEAVEKEQRVRKIAEKRRREKNDRLNESEEPKKKVTYKSMVSDVKEAYEEVRKEEKQFTFKDRRNLFDLKFYNAFYPKNVNIVNEAAFQFCRGTVRIFDETWFQLKKMSHITHDSIPKFVIRNRVAIASTLTAVALVSAIGSLSELDKLDDSFVDNVMSSVDSYDSEDEIVVNSENIVSALDEGCILNRVYTVKEGDALSVLAYDAGVSVDYIKEVNNLYSSGLIVGQLLTIPYYVKDENLEYYTEVERCMQGIDVSKYASQVGTDLETIMNLNQGVVTEINGIYTSTSDTLVVPNFISKDELKNKENNKSSVTYSLQ